MYLFLWELGSYRQLSRLRPHVLREIEASLDHAMIEEGARHLRGEQGLRLYGADLPGSDAAHRVARLLSRLRSILDGKRGDLAGFGLLVDRRGSEDAGDLRRLEAALRSAPEDEAFWLTESAASPLAPHLSLERRDSLSRIIGVLEAPPMSALGPREIAAHAPALERVLETLDPWLRGEAAPELILFSGLRHPSGLFVIEAALEKLCGGANEWLRVGAFAPGRAWEYAFAAEIDEALLTALPEELAAPERELWTRSRHFLTGLLRSSAYDDLADRTPLGFAAAYRLYWHGRLRGMIRKGLPPIVTVAEIDALPRDGQSFLLDLLRDREDGAPLVLASALSGGIPEVFAELETVEVELSPLESMEIAEAARRKLPESATRLFRVPAALRVTRGDPVQVHHHLRNLEARQDQAVAEEGHSRATRASGPSLPAESMRFVEQLSDGARDILLIAHALAGTGDGALVAEIARQLGYDDAGTQRHLQQLVADGLVSDETTARLHVALAEGLLSKRTKERYERVREAIIADLSARYRSGSRPLDRSFLAIIGDALGESLQRVAASRLFEHLLHRNNLNACADMLAAETARVNAVGSTVREPSRHRAMLGAWRLRLALATRDPARATRAFQDMPGGSEDPAIDGPVQHAVALYQNSQAKLDLSIRAIKRSVVAYQSVRDELGIAAANLEYARFLLGRGAVLESLEQLNRGRIAGPGEEAGRVASQRAVVDAVVSFVYGNLTRVNENAEYLISTLAGQGQRESYLFGLLLRGRVLFEMGRYEEALVWFASCLTESRRLGHRQSFLLFETWLARAEAYAGRFEAARRRLVMMQPGMESRFFLAEARWLAGDVASAVDAAEDAVAAGLPRGHVVPERFDWSTGFASIEEQLSISQDEGVLASMVAAFHAFLQGSTSRLDEALPTLRRLTRGIAPLPYDPYRGLYCFWYSSVLAGASAEVPDNAVTMLGKAVKLMQERLSHMDAPQDRSGFFKENYWHRRLIQNARRHNMV